MLGEAIQGFEGREEAQAAATVARENGWPEAKAVVFLYLEEGAEAYSAAWAVCLAPDLELYLCADGEARP